MSISETTKHLLQLLSDTDNRVIALSGKWGTGKTHLWNNVKELSDDPKVKTARYVSLFGLSNIDQVKRKLIESAIPVADRNSGIFDSFKQILRVGVKAGAEHYKAIGTLNDLNLLMMAPVILRGSVVMIDDVERKHKNLGIDELLGFIDEFSLQHQARFVLVLNTHQLAQSEMWNMLREKVIDQELTLSTTPLEAVSIALKLRPSTHIEAIRERCIECGLVNIRTIEKVIRSVDQVLNSYKLPPEALARLVPRIVTLSAIHFDGIDDGPDLEYVMKLGKGRNNAMEPGIGAHALSPDDTERHERWHKLLHSAGIFGCDEFDATVIDFLRSGRVNDEKIRPLIQRYASDGWLARSQAMADDLLKQLKGNHKATEEELLRAAENLVGLAGYIEPWIATELCTELSILPNGQSVGQRIIDAWISSFNAQINGSRFGTSAPSDLHPDILAAIAAYVPAPMPHLTLIEALEYFAQDSDWMRTFYEFSMREASDADYKMAIQEMNVKLLPDFMRRMFKLLRERASGESKHDKALTLFVLACRDIIADPKLMRLARQVEREFQNSGLAGELKLVQANFDESLPL